MNKYTSAGEVARMWSGQQGIHSSSLGWVNNYSLLSGVEIGCEAEPASYPVCINCSLPGDKAARG